MIYIVVTYKSSEPEILEKQSRGEQKDEFSPSLPFFPALHTREFRLNRVITHTSFITNDDATWKIRQYRMRTPIQLFF